MKALWLSTFYGASKDGFQALGVSQRSELVGHPAGDFVRMFQDLSGTEHQREEQGAKWLPREVAGRATPELLRTLRGNGIVLAEMWDENIEGQPNYNVGLAIPTLVEGTTYMFSCAIPMTRRSLVAASAQTAFLQELQDITKFFNAFRQAVLVEPFASAVQTFCQYHVNEYLNVDYPSKFLYNPLSGSRDEALQWLYKHDPTHGYSELNYARTKNAELDWTLQEKLGKISCAHDAKSASSSSLSNLIPGNQPSCICSTEKRGQRREILGFDMNFLHHHSRNWAFTNDCFQPLPLLKGSCEQRKQKRRKPRLRNSKQVIAAETLAQNDVTRTQSIVQRFLSIQPGNIIVIGNYIKAAWLSGVRARVVQACDVPIRHLKPNIDGRKLRFKIEYQENDRMHETETFKYPETVSILNVCQVLT